MSTVTLNGKYCSTVATAFADRRNKDIDTLRRGQIALTEILPGKSIPQEEIKEIDPQRNVTAALFGIGGNLASKGFLRWGLDEVNTLIGEVPIEWTGIDLKEGKEAEQLVADITANKKGSYRLRQDIPYVSVGELEKARGLKPNIVIDATPASCRLDNALLAAQVLQAEQEYGEKPFGLANNPGMLVKLNQLVQDGRNGSPTTKVDAIDFFLYTDAYLFFVKNMQQLMNGLGQVKEVHASCTEPWNVGREKSRVYMLMNPALQGGYIGADQLPHPLTMIDVFLRSHLSSGLENVELKNVERIRDTSIDPFSKVGTLDGETSMNLVGQVKGSNIKVVAGCGKGINIPGTSDNEPAATYMLEVQMEHGRIEVCAGSEQVDPYVAVVPDSPGKKTEIFLFKDGGFSYKRFLTDVILRAQGSTIPLDRLKDQTDASLSAMSMISQAYARVEENPTDYPLKKYDYSTGEQPYIDLETLPRTSVHPFIQRRKYADRFD